MTFTAFTQQPLMFNRSTSICEKSLGKPIPDPKVALGGGKFKKKSRVVFVVQVFSSPVYCVGLENPHRRRNHHSGSYFLHIFASRCFLCSYCCSSVVGPSLVLRL